MVVKILSPFLTAYFTVVCAHFFPLIWCQIGSIWALSNIQASLCLLCQEKFERLKSRANRNFHFKLSIQCFMSNEAPCQHTCQPARFCQETSFPPGGHSFPVFLLICDKSSPFSYHNSLFMSCSHLFCCTLSPSLCELWTVNGEEKEILKQVLDVLKE